MTNPSEQSIEEQLMEVLGLTPVFGALHPSDLAKLRSLQALVDKATRENFRQGEYHALARVKEVVSKRNADEWYMSPTAEVWLDEYIEELSNKEPVE